jgi:hypothetical protein
MALAKTHHPESRTHALRNKNAKSPQKTKGKQPPNKKEERAVLRAGSTYPTGFFNSRSQCQSVPTGYSYMRAWCVCGVHKNSQADGRPAQVIGEHIWIVNYIHGIADYCICIASGI